MSDESSSVPECIWVAAERGDAFIRIAGRASFLVGPSLKQLGATLVEKQVQRLVIDMESCSSVDSTFLGVLAGLAAKLKKSPGASISMINLAPALFENVSTLGLDMIIKCFATGRTPPDIRDRMDRLGSPSCFAVDRPDEDTARETVIEAHENLIRTDQRNLLKFKNVIAFLKESGRDKTH